MFTGLIRELGTVESYNNNTLKVKATYSPNIGDSIAINGACLTVVHKTSTSFSVEVSPETEAFINMKALSGKVHMEPAMAMGDRFEGHIVQGHIDCLGTISQISDNGNSTDFFINIPQEFHKFLVPKGSVTVDGVSLTINSLTDNGFRLTIIPHTIKETLFSTYKLQSLVNIETDMFARYVHNILANQKNIKRDDLNRIAAIY